jgi:hypothetical protein
LEACDTCRLQKVCAENDRLRGELERAEKRYEVRWDALAADRDAALSRATKAEAALGVAHEQLHRSATVCPKDGCMLWRGHEQPHQTAEDLTRLMAEREAMLKCVEAARDMSREYARLDSGEDIPLSDEFAFDNAWERVRDALSALDKLAKEG